MAQSDEPDGWITHAAARGIVASLLCVKLAVTAWNCLVFDGISYDQGRHVRRAAVGGLAVSDLNYDAPTYYLPALALTKMRRQAWRAAALEAREEPAGEERRSRAGRKDRSPYLDFLRATNLVYVGVFYLIWIYGVLPRAIPAWRPRLLAATLLLALPGFQKLAVMPHPDNLHLAMAALCTMLWLRLAGVSAPEAGAARGWGANLGLAVVTGLAGLTRPFAAATVATFAAANVVHLRLRDSGGRFAFRAIAIVALTAVIASSWLVWRGFATGAWRESYGPGYIERYDRRGFDWFGYLTSFHIGSLLEVPNRRIARLDEDNWKPERTVATNRYANSFFTTLYSETWGDHWLYFSGPLGADRKVVAKRVIFLVALPLVPLLLLRFGAATVSLARRARASGTRIALDPAAVLLVHFAAGAALFLAWQFASALSPGKQSSIKFIYNAYLYAPAVTYCFTAPLQQRRFRTWLPYLLVVFLAALPIATFVPRRW